MLAIANDYSGTLRHALLDRREADVPLATAYRVAYLTACDNESEADEDRLYQALMDAWDAWVASDEPRNWEVLIHTGPSTARMQRVRCRPSERAARLALALGLGLGPTGEGSINMLHPFCGHFMDHLRIECEPGDKAAQCSQPNA